jgi:hypothetical protein
LNARSHFRICSLGGKVYAIGGLSIDKIFDKRTAHPQKSVEMFDPEKNSWTPVADLNEPRHTFGVCVIGDYIYVAGGQYTIDGSPTADGFPVGNVERYDPSTNKWTTIKKPPTPPYVDKSYVILADDETESDEASDSECERQYERQRELRRQHERQRERRRQHERDDSDDDSNDINDDSNDDSNDSNDDSYDNDSDDSYDNEGSEGSYDSELDDSFRRQRSFDDELDDNVRRRRLHMSLDPLERARIFEVNGSACIVHDELGEGEMYKLSPDLTEWEYMGRLPSAFLRYMFFYSQSDTLSELDLLIQDSV